MVKKGRNQCESNCKYHHACMHNRHQDEEENIKCKRKLFKQKFTQYWKSFANRTTLHGFKYLGESEIPLCERIFWVTTMTLVFIAAVQTVYEQTYRYQCSPVLISLDTEPTYIHCIPFPALSVCPVDHIMKLPTEKSFTYAHELDLSQFICYGSRKNFRKEGASPMLNFVSDKAASRVLNRILSYEMCSKLIRGIIWMNKVDKDPCKYFQPTTYKHGYCFTFNMLPLEKIYTNSIQFPKMHKKVRKCPNTLWSIDEGYPPHYPSHRVPWRSGGNGVENGVGILVKYPDPNTTCLKGITEYSVIFHSPHELPGPSHVTVPIHFGSYTIAQVKPRIVNTSEVLLKWAPNERGCYFEHEKKLNLFTTYNQKNCDLECEINRTLQLCDCSPVYHPRKRGTPVCGVERLNCVRNSMLRDPNKLNKSMFCDCKPSCNELEYDVHYSSYKRSWPVFFGQVDKLNLISEVSSLFRNKSSELGGIYVSFLNKYPMAIRRNNISSRAGFLGNIGGLLGLFLGFSVLSLAEIIYLLFIKPCLSVCRSHEET